MTIKRLPLHHRGVKPPEIPASELIEGDRWDETLPDLTFYWRWNGKWWDHVGDTFEEPSNAKDAQHRDPEDK